MLLCSYILQVACSASHGVSNIETDSSVLHAMVELGVTVYEQHIMLLQFVSRNVVCIRSPVARWAQQSQVRVSAAADVSDPRLKEMPQNRDRPQSYTGACFVVKDNIDTDQIIPAEYLTLVPSKVLHNTAQTVALLLFIP